MSAETVRLVEQIYQCFATGDLAAVFTLLSPRIEWNQAENSPYADGNPYHGPDDVLNGVFARLGRDWEGYDARVEQMLDAGDTVVVLGRYNGTCKLTGRPMSPQMAHVWTLADGQAVKFQQLVDTLAIAHATGAA